MEEVSDFDKMLLLGLIEPAALDPETGEMLYSFSKDLEQLWELGFISMDVTHQNPMVSLTPKAFDENEIKLLDEDMRFSLSEIKRGLLQ
jgi:hypothetical protein